MQKILTTKTVLGLVIIATVLVIPKISAAQTTTTPTNYTLLAPIPLGTSSTTVVNVGPGGIQTYVVDVLNLVYGLAAVLAIIVIIIGGVQYMSTDAIYGKQEGRKRINDALFGLLLVICSWIILYTINPNLVSLSLLSNDINSAPSSSSTSSTTPVTTSTTTTPTGSTMTPASTGLYTFTATPPNGQAVSLPNLNQTDCQSQVSSYQALYGNNATVMATVKCTPQ